MCVRVCVCVSVCERARECAVTVFSQNMNISLKNHWDKSEEDQSVQNRKEQKSEQASFWTKRQNKPKQNEQLHQTNLKNSLKEQTT